MYAFIFLRIGQKETKISEKKQEREKEKREQFANIKMCLLQIIL